ncbi:polysaccharide pyruvyl transferase family protein [Aureicoccus marinus]|uniref:Polysaccharide pyruvyl transferase domain-containing protein n=1 Tax=Aureicoccus marinus TaxID=754435 RepID=A0A2S7T9P8_9FLAO|nr:polysaccharide pyruvyl transferase family protein [Aureicoccus marinus]PQJ16237.1 hypothetical protein BST99_11345 [Aureicoccus marinus]
MKYALFEHKQSNLGLVNIGDHIQSCAAEQFLPHVDFYVERDHLNNPDYDKALVIMNGWFTDAPHNWPPNPNLDPLFVSFHLQPTSAAIILEKPENIDYLKKHQPIGCRDYRTVELLKNKGIEAYFSFCLTTTLDEKYKYTEGNREGIYMVDPLYGYDKNLLSKISFAEALKGLSLSRLKKLIKLKDYFKKDKAKIEDYVPSSIIDKAESVEHYVDSKQSTDELYRIARSILKKYAKAELVITSRIHCALPCLALGTPVLFVMEGLTDEKQHMSRFRGILDHINILTTQSKAELNELFGKEMNVYHPDEVDFDNPPTNPESFRALSDALKEKCRAFIGQAELKTESAH